MRNECNIVRDILPLYIDEIISRDTISFVEEHLEKCETCRTEFEKMKVPNALEKTICDTQVNDEIPLKSFLKKWNRKKRILITSFAAIFLIAVLIASCFVSYLKFDTANPFSAASGFIQITVADKEYFEIQHNPKVILAQPSDALFEEYMKSRGFTEVERYGGLRVYENGDEQERIMYSQNAYFSKWTWE